MHGEAKAPYEKDVCGKPVQLMQPHYSHESVSMVVSSLLAWNI